MASPLAGFTPMQLILEKNGWSAGLVQIELALYSLPFKGPFDNRLDLDHDIVNSYLLFLFVC